jgi:hypothetical protein
MGNQDLTEGNEGNKGKTAEAVRGVRVRGRTLLKQGVNERAGSDADGHGAVIRET